MPTVIVRLREKGKHIATTNQQEATTQPTGTLMRLNGKEYYQLPTGELMSISNLLDDLGGEVQDLIPQSLHNPHAERRLPYSMNTDDLTRTCQYCNTAFRISEIKHEGRCPFCWRLI
jgi:hypothetical protein